KTNVTLCKFQQPSHFSVRLIESYFLKLIFKHVETKQGYFLYAACVGKYGNERGKYVILFVPEGCSTIVTGTINQLRWRNLQTRTIKNEYKLPVQHWSIPRNVDDIEFQNMNRSDTESQYYSSQCPFEILLLHNPKKKTIFQWR